ncbi:MAG: threonylcarbamoyl-AMP synthase [Candidatus Sumerlaeia bacterium]|nr:threonylcarbamoyl-AMP synthase [Candidatus Sumerlaeia bacterium]
MADDRQTRLLGADVSSLDAAAGILRRGGLVAMPTETVYGLAANALDGRAVSAIYTAKGRPASNPLIVHVESAEQASGLSSGWSEMAVKLAEAFWPGPLTLVVPAGDAVAREALAGGSTVGLRAPAHPVALELIRRAGVPLAAPSANRSNALSPTSARAVMDDLAGRIDAVVDGGDCHVGIESTVLDLTEEAPRVLRPGMVTPGDISAVLGVPVSLVGENAGIHKSPGMMSRHYAPGIPLELIAGEIEDNPDGFPIRLGDAEVWGREGIVLIADPVPYARALYRALKWAEMSGCTRIVLELPPVGPRWTAIHDRLLRASRG